MTELSIRRRLRDLLIWPQVEVKCSQTLYETVLGCLDLHQLTNDNVWKERAVSCAHRLCKSQNEDGGFNIGFNFVFGRGLMKRKWDDSTTPELLSVYSLLRVRDELQVKAFNENIKLGLNWLIRNSYKLSDGERWAIPYCPGTVFDPHITNSVSFALPALAASGTAENESVRREIFDGYLNFLLGELETDSEIKGAAYWRYFYRGGANFRYEAQQGKIDNYHMAQQLHYQCVVQAIEPDDRAMKIIRQVGEYLLGIRNDHGIFEYCNQPEFSPSDVQVWGFSSVIQGLVSAGFILEDERYLVAARTFSEWLLENCWNGEYFFPVLDVNGRVLEREWYPRTNAWVFHSLSYFMLKLGRDERILAILEKVYTKLEVGNFQGRERNTWSKRLLFAVRLQNALLRKESHV